MAEKHGPDKYGLTRRFERTIAGMSCTSPTFWRRLGHEIDPERLEQEECRNALRAARAIAKDTGRGPDSGVLIVQRLRTWQDEGRLPAESVAAVVVLLDEVEDLGLPSEDAVVAELTPIIKKALEKDATKLAIATYGKPEADWSRVTSAIQHASTVGRVDSSQGIALGPAAFPAIREMRARDRLPTGIAELDAFLDGGLQRCGLGLVLADSGGGKSMFLTEVTCHAAFLGNNAAYCTTELPEGEILSRTIANLLGMPIHQIQNGHMEEAKARLMEIHPQLGLVVVKYFEPRLTTVEQVLDWVKDVEQESGRPITLVSVDYADRLASGDAGRHDTEYKTQGMVVERLRISAQRKKSWVWTASQVKSPGDARRKRIDINDAADSKNKPRYSDLVISANVTEQQEEVSFYVAKHLTGRSRASVGPLPTDFACGRIAPVCREYAPF